MAKSSVSYVCQQCGGAHRKWSGRCDHCGAWNTLVEERIETPSGPSKKVAGRQIDMQPLATSADTPPPPRMKTGLGEFDRVSGGGLVKGSATLIGGDPGCGKSTLLLQLVCRLAAAGARAAYVSGEESAEQVRMRARRLGLGEANVELATVTNAGDIAASLGGPDGPDVVVIDSIQTMYLPTLDSAPGTVSQVRASAQELIRAAKGHDVALLVVGHVTKDGAIAGPRVLEHMVDTVLYFEGDRSHHFRILRGVKNRFGATDEIGVFEMVETGLAEVPNPSELFLADRRDEVTGAVVFAGIEGSRPVLVEIEALVAPSTLASPRRNVVGWDGSEAGDADRRSGSTVRRAAVRPRHFPECGRRAEDFRDGSGPRRCRGADLVGQRSPGPAEKRVLRRGGTVRRTASGSAGRLAAEGSGETGIRHGCHAEAAQEARRPVRPVDSNRRACH